MPIMMRSIVYSTGLLAMATLALTGCPKKSGDAGDGGGDAAVAVIDAGAPVKIANEADVKRYPSDESALDGDATVLAPTAAARTAAPGGAIVATLKQGTTVTQLVEHNGNYLVTFDDPKDATRRLEGWVGKGAFQPPKPFTKIPVKVPTCAGGDLLSIGGDEGLRCRKNCSEDTDCPAGNKCEGLSPADPKGNIIPFQTVLVCEPVAPAVVPKDGGAPTPAAKPDAGSAPSGPILPPRFDAGH